MSLQDLLARLGEAVPTVPTKSEIDRNSRATPSAVASTAPPRHAPTRTPLYRQNMWGRGDTQPETQQPRGFEPSPHTAEIVGKGVGTVPTCERCVSFIADLSPKRRHICGRGDTCFKQV